ncbi:DUF1028 domain-containing protein [Brevundimonas sp.]|uniref:DUF1028 domain-containing protein n=1 Tax=Brevundimonas sp. TaxID=1871086 RepID=UPI00391C2345
MNRVHSCISRLGGAALVILFTLVLPGAANATYSIVACDSTRSCGAAVATHNLAVGATVIYARAGAGALATQFETNPNYGPAGLSLLEAGHDADQVLANLLANDGNFEGQGPAFRQLGVVSAGGSASVFTGSEALASPWAGDRYGPMYSVQGNGLAGAAVLEAMEAAFLASDGKPLAERLLLALEAGEAVGGQTIGGMSAALLVRTPDGTWSDTDFRVDASSRPIQDLRRLWNFNQAHSHMIRAERSARRSDAEAAARDIDTALVLGGDWDRIQRRAARLWASLGRSGPALEALTAFIRLNPAWGRIEIADPLYDPLRADSTFPTGI